MYIPLKSWYKPGKMMVAIASSLLNVRKTWSLAVQLTLMLFMYITVAAMRNKQQPLIFMLEKHCIKALVYI